MKKLKDAALLYKVSPLARRILIYILLASTTLACFATGVQLYTDYSQDISLINDRMDQVEKGNLSTIAFSLWALDNRQLDTQLEAIVQLPNIHYVELRSSHGQIYTSGNKDIVGATLKKIYPISYHSPFEKSYELGTLSVVAEISSVYDRLLRRAGLILTTQFIKTLIVSLIILLIVDQLIIRHLHRVSSFAKNQDLGKLGQSLTLDRKYSESNTDELDDLVSSINEMRDTLINDIAALKDKEREILEQQEIATELQTQLVDAEQKAALSGLVAGVAHEINTPVSIGVTAVSHIEVIAKNLEESYRTGEMSRSDFEKFFDDLKVAITMTSSNLMKAANLIKSFKTVAVDQAAEDQRVFNLKDYINEVITSLKPKLKHSKHKLDIECPNNLMINSYPGALSQIITIFIMNSLIHGFENIDSGIIKIEIKQESGNLILIYSDDGKGVSPDVLKKIFEPFFTTKRHKGGSGLGMHIAYNLITKLLDGEITCVSKINEGTTFTVSLPIE